MRFHENVQLSVKLSNVNPSRFHEAVFYFRKSIIRKRKSRFQDVRSLKYLQNFIIRWDEI